MDILLVGIAALLGFYMAWNIGANDVANSMADAVGSKAITVRQAVILAGICEFAGAVLVGSHVTDTVRKGIVSPEALASIPGLMPGDAATLLVIGMTAPFIPAFDFIVWQAPNLGDIALDPFASSGFGSEKSINTGMVRIIADDMSDRNRVDVVQFLPIDDLIPTPIAIEQM